MKITPGHQTIHYNPDEEDDADFSAKITEQGTFNIELIGDVGNLTLILEPLEAQILWGCLSGYLRHWRS